MTSALSDILNLHKMARSRDVLFVVKQMKNNTTVDNLGLKWTRILLKV